MENRFEMRPIRIEENSSLFEDFLYDYSRVAKFFSWEYPGEVEQCVQARLARYSIRQKVRDILLDQNRGWDAPASTIGNIEKIGRENTLAVVTGQQAGLYGGPLYTVYKVITAIKLATHLEQKHSEFSFVPCFWMEVGDNDYREINHFHLLNVENEVVRLELPDEPGNFHSVSAREIPAEIEEIHKKLREICPPSEFQADVLSRANDIYKAGRSFSDSFARWLLSVFGDYGLVVMNPTGSEFGELARPLFRTALEKHQQIRYEFETVSRELKNIGYHTQVALSENQTLLFYETEDGARSRVDAGKDGFEIRHHQQPIQMGFKDLENEIGRRPQRFSPNVALRPVLQDFLLPTVAYVGGPGEISYAAQLKPVYRALGVEQPIFISRARVTLVEKKIQKVVEKFRLDYSEIFEYRDKIADEFVRRNTGENLQKEFSEAEHQFAEILSKLEGYLTGIDPSLHAGVEKTQEHIQQGLQILRGKASEMLKKKMETEVRQLDKLASNLFPDGNYQERIVNVLHYLVRYGPGFLASLHDAISVETAQHQLVLL